MTNCGHWLSVLLPVNQAARLSFAKCRLPCGSLRGQWDTPQQVCYGSVASCRRCERSELSLWGARRQPQRRRGKVCARERLAESSSLPGRAGGQVSGVGFPCMWQLPPKLRPVLRCLPGLCPQLSCDFSQNKLVAASCFPCGPQPPAAALGCSEWGAGGTGVRAECSQTLDLSSE